jgi:hypothetical protein
MNNKVDMLLIWFYAALLALLPFTWWPANQHLVGGDDIKYEYISPAMKIVSLLDGNQVSLSVSESSVIQEVSGFPFYLILTSFRTAMPFLNTQQLVSALVLSGSFLAFYWLTSTIPLIGRAQGRVPVIMRFVSANVYALSTFNIVTMWSHQLPEYVYMATLPLIVGFFMRSATRYSVADSIAAALALALSPIPYGAAPWLIPVAICGLPLVIALAFDHPRDTLSTFLTFSLATMVLLFPVWIAMYEFSGYTQGLFDAAAVKEGGRIFMTLNQNNSLFNPIALTPNEWLLGNLHLYREYPRLFKVAINSLIPIVFALVVTSTLTVGLRDYREHRKIFAGVLLSWGLSVVLYAGGGVKILFTYLAAGIEAFPFLIMFRNNYDKFAMAISLFSSIMLYYSLALIYSLRNLSKNAILN